MRVLNAVVVAVFLASGLALAQGTMSVPYTAVQQTGVEWARARFNAANPDDPSISVLAYGIAACQAAFDAFAADRSAEQFSAASVEAKYLSLEDVDKVSVEAFIDDLLSP